MIKKIISALAVVAVFMLLSAPTAQAQGWFQNIFGGGGGGGSQNTDITISKEDLGLPGTPEKISGKEVAAVLNLVYAAAAFVAIIVIVIGGIRYTTSNGDASGIQTAKNTIMYAVVGLIVVIMAAAITNFVIAMVGTQSGGTP